MDADVRAAVEEWIVHRLPGEPQELTENRRRYVEHHLDRCMRLLRLIPNPGRRGRLLELGSGLYLMTFLMRRILNYDLDLTQYLYLEGTDRQCESILETSDGGSHIVLPFRNFNAETDIFPYPDLSFDVILNSEMMEHITCNPVHVLSESHRILKPGGLVVLSTPNAIRTGNIAGLLQGNNIYYKYCKETPYGRHPREFSPEEIHRLFEETGFRVTHIETADDALHTERWIALALARMMVAAVSAWKRCRGGNDWSSTAWRGGHIFLVAVKADAPVAMTDFLFEAPGLVAPITEAIRRPCVAKG